MQDPKSHRSPVVDIAKKTCPAVITIVVSKDLPKVEGFFLLPYGNQELVMPDLKDEKEKTKIGGGSGFIISPDGYIFTCSHVVSDPAAEYTVIIDPVKKYKAQVLAQDPLIDVAILKISAKNLPYLECGDSDKTDLGETVLAIGNPLGEFEDTLSAGIISGLSRSITARNSLPSKTTSLRGLIQTDAAINPGNSGGPLVDMEGKAIGINTAVAMGAQNIGFAIPINYAKRVLEEVKKHGRLKRPFLGLRYVILNKEISRSNKLPVDYGALIVRERLGEPAIIKNSPVEKAGLKEYDIVLEMNGEKITEANALTDVMQRCKIGDEILLKVLREGKEIKAGVKLKEKK
ncbi:MAG: trypsin-like peptidase domain-containing protein [bacterium]|nr:trypsin-like peptidase domain-containing protein [bacterium]